MILFYNFFVLYESTLDYIFAILMSGSSHIRSVLIGVEYQNGQILDVYLLFAILLGQIFQNLNY